MSLHCNLRQLKSVGCPLHRSEISRIEGFTLSLDYAQLDKKNKITLRSYIELINQIQMLFISKVEYNSFNLLNCSQNSADCDILVK